MLPLLLCLALSAPAVVADGLDDLLASKPLRGAQVSLMVADAGTGAVVFAHEPDLALIPASNMKVLTTAAAVSLLGPDYRFTTRLLSAAPPVDGVLAGDLVLWGGGDPCLRADITGAEESPARLLARMLREAGVRRVEGALVLDDAFLDREWVHPDWEADDLPHGYAAPVSALSLDGNLLTVRVDGQQGARRPAARLRTDVGGYAIQNELGWATDADTNLISLLRPDDGGRVRLRGRLARGLAARDYQVTVRDGALFFGRCLLAALELEGVRVAGGLARDGGAGRALDEAHQLVQLETPLAVAVLLANKESDNSISDHLFKVLGAVVEGDGSFAGGGRAVERFLTEVVDADPATLALRDGSGLARSNRITTRVLVETLVAMNGQDGPTRDLFLRSFPVAGRDGTLKDRLRELPYQGAVRAKTGYIREVSSLSGYVRTGGGRTLAFSILINDFPKTFRNRDMKGVQDDLCRLLFDQP